MKRSIFLTSFFSTQRSGSKPFTSQAKRVRVLGGVEEGDGAGARPAGQEAGPGLLGADAERGHEPDARHHDPASAAAIVTFRTPGGTAPTSWPCPPCFSM